MCGVCVSVQSASLAPAAYVAGFAAVGTAGWHRLKRGREDDTDTAPDEDLADATADSP